MGDVLSGLLGTDSAVNVEHGSQFQQIQPWQQSAGALNSQLSTEAAGGGPNPAQQQFMQNSQQIAQQQANSYAQNRALNPGLAARMSGNTAANLQQNAASTAGIQQAQQQLAAQHLQGNLISQQQTALNQAGQVNAGIAGGNQQQSGAIVGGLFNAGGAAMGLADGGMVPGYAEGGSIPMPTADDWASSMSNNSGIPNGTDWALMMGSPGAPAAAPAPAAAKAPMAPFAAMGKLGGPMTAPNYSLFQGPAMSAGGQVGPLSNAGKHLHSVNMKSGGSVSGRAQIRGDSPRNDTVPAMLSPGEIVIPRSAAQDPEHAKAFLAAILAKNGMKRSA